MEMLKKFGITPLEKVVYALIILGLAIIAYLFYFNPGLLSQIVQEDALVENITVLVLAACFVVAIIKISGFIKQKDYKGVLAYTLLALALFFVIGEEISWGQRIFHIKSDEFFLKNNTQSELNLHNLKIGDTRINTLIFTQLGTLFLAVYFLLSRWLCRKVAWMDKIRSQFHVPLPKVHHAIFFYFSFIMVYIFHYKRNNEVFELILPAIFFLILLYPYQPKEKAGK